MNIYRTKKGYFYKKYKNGKTKRISEKDYKKLLKRNKLNKKTKKVKGGASSGASSGAKASSGNEIEEKIAAKIAAKIATINKLYKEEKYNEAKEVINECLKMDITEDTKEALLMRREALATLHNSNQHNQFEKLAKDMERARTMYDNGSSEEAIEILEKWLTEPIVCKNHKDIEVKLKNVIDSYREKGRKGKGEKGRRESRGRNNKSLGLSTIPEEEE